MYMSEQGLKSFYSDIIKNIAEKLTLDCDFKVAEELLEEIKNKDMNISNLLNTFLETYQEWYDFHLKIEKEDKQGNLSSEEYNTLMDLISKRDKTRESLLTARDKL